MQENPDLSGHYWLYEEETVVVDLNFGNFSRLVPDFKCDGDVIDWIAEDGSIHSTINNKILKIEKGRFYSGKICQSNCSE